MDQPISAPPLAYVNGEALPPPGAAVEMAPGVHWLRMPLPFKLDHINLWLVEDGDGVAIVDCGIGRDEVKTLWRRVWDATLRGRRITRVIATHFHPDHLGLAAWLTETWGVELWCTHGEYMTGRAVWSLGGPADDAARDAFYRRHGVGADGIAALAERGNHYPHLVPAIPPAFRRIADGEVLTLGKHAWRVIVARGHAPEHACLWCESLGILISGDQVLPRITTNVSVWPMEPEADPLGLYLGSLDLFRKLPKGVLVLPSHDRPFRGLHARLDMLAKHHAERLDLVRAACREAPKAAVDMIPVLFGGRQLDTHQLSFAVGESVSHLRHLESEGTLARETDKQGVIRFRAA